MAIQIVPRVQQDPGRSQLGGVQQGVEPYRDFRGQQMQQAGQGVQRLGQGVGAAGEAIQDDIDVGFSANLVKDLGSEALRIRGEYDQKAGQDAIGDSHKRAKEEFRQARSRIESRAQNNTQRDNFKRLADDIEMRTLGAIDHHHANEAKAHRAGQMKALADLGRVDYLDSLGTERAELAKASALQAIEDRGRTLGLSDEEIAVDKLEWTSRTHETAVRMLVGSRAAGASTAAGKYLARHGGEMGGPVREEMGRLVQNATDDDNAAQLADFYAKQGFSIESARTASQKLYEEGKISLGVRDGAVERHRSAINQAEDDRTRERNVSVRDATDFATANRVSSYETLPPEQRTRLERSGGDNAMRTFFARGGQRITTSAGANFMADLAADPSRLRQFRTVDAMQAALVNELDDDDMRKASALWGKAHEPGDPSDAMDKAQAGTHIYFQMKDAGLIPSPSVAAKEDEGDPDRELARADRIKRLQLAVEMEARQLGGEKWLSRKVLDEAFQNVAKQSIYDANDKQVPMAMLSNAEINNPEDPAYWKFGDQTVQATALSGEAKVRAATAIREENEDAEAYNTAAGLKQGDMGYRPLRDPESVVELARQVGEDRMAAAARKRAAEAAAEAERVRGIRALFPMRETGR